MNNLNTLLIGTTGSGKTTMAKRLLSVTPRAIVLDSEYEYDDGAIFEGFAEALGFLREYRAEDFHLVFRSENVRELFAMIDCAYQMQRIEDLPPLGLFLEEASLYSTTHELDPVVERAVTKGRRQKLNVVTVTQWETQQNVIIRAMSRQWIAFQQHALSSDMRRRFSPDEQRRMPTLTPLTPGVDPVYGLHYVTSPPMTDPVERWIAAVTA